MRTDLHKAARASEVMAALLDFEQTPGRYPVAMREPRMLFEQAGLVLMLAAGRQLGVAGANEVQPGVRQAACFFVRTVMLRPGVDYYTLLGLPHTFDADLLREHYRLMIRMTHPDFAASGAAWPSDAAARINQAHDVLASADKRDAYQATLESAHARPKSPGVSVHGPRPAARAAVPRRKWSLRRTIGMAAALLLLAVTSLILSWPSSEDGLLTVAVRAPLAAPAAAPPEPVVVAVVPPQMDEPASWAEPVAVGVVPPLERSPVAAVVPAAEPVARVRRVVAEAVVGEREVVEPEPSLPPPVVAMAVVAAELPRPVEPAPAPAPVKLEPAVEVPNVSLSQVQPMLTNVIASLQSGQGEQVLQWLERSSRHNEAASSFAAAYHQSLAGARVTGLGPARFSSRFAAGQLVVDGMVQLQLQDARQRASRQDFRLRAYFSARDGGPVLARLEAY